MKVELIEHAWSRWSVRAGAALTAMWAAVAAAWALIEPQTQASILADWGLAEMTLQKAFAYGALLTALSNGLVLGLRVLRQPDPQ